MLTESMDDPRIKSVHKSGSPCFDLPETPS